MKTALSIAAMIIITGCHVGKHSCAYEYRGEAYITCTGQKVYYTDHWSAEIPGNRSPGISRRQRISVATARKMLNCEY